MISRGLRDTVISYQTKKKKRLKDTVLYNKKPIQNYPIRKNDEKSLRGEIKSVKFILSLIQ